jgi:hypothetical protein
VDQALAEGVADVVVRVDGTTTSTTTDEQGRFALEPVPTGPITLVAEGATIEPLRVEVDAARQTEPIVLRVAYAIREEYTVVVTGSRPRPLTASTSRVTDREMAAAPRRNAEDALRLVPGLTLVQHGSEGKGHQFFLRGFDAVHGADLELTVEGVPVNEWSNIHAQGYLDLGFVIPEVVRSIRARSRWPAQRTTVWAFRRAIVDGGLATPSARRTDTVAFSRTLRRAETAASSSPSRGCTTMGSARDAGLSAAPCSGGST